MGRKPKFSKEQKIRACIDYKTGKGSITSIAKSIGASPETFRQWYLSYEAHEESAFDHSMRNKSYSSDFKNAVVEEYLSGKHSLPELSAKHLISTGVLRKWINKRYNGIELKDYDPKGEVYSMKSRKTTLEERIEIVKWVIENGMNYKDAATKFANNYANVYKWTKAYLSKGVEGLKDKKRGPKPRSVVNEESLTEIEKLKLELERERTLRKRREFELEVLKKKEEIESKIRFRK